MFKKRKKESAVYYCEHCGEQTKGEIPEDEMLMLVCSYCEYTVFTTHCDPTIGYFPITNEEFLLSLANTATLGNYPNHLTLWNPYAKETYYGST